MKLLRVIEANKLLHFLTFMIFIILLSSCRKERLFERITINGSGNNVIKGMPYPLDIHSTSSPSDKPFEINIRFNDYNHYDLLFGTGTNNPIQLVILTDSLLIDTYNLSVFPTEEGNIIFDCTEFTLIESINVIDSIETVYVPGGIYTQGSSNGNIDEQPTRMIEVAPFYISKFEITVQQYCDFLNDFKGVKIGTDSYYSSLVVWFGQAKIYWEYGGCNNLLNTDGQIIFENDVLRPKSGKENQPIVKVSWIGAKMYCAWAGGRLPSEAEWEWAAKGAGQGVQNLYSGGNISDSIAWTANNSNGLPHNVGQLQPNELGIYDMTGNAMEWIDDIYKMYDDTTQSIGWLRKGSDRNVVLRGGSFKSEAYRNSQRNFDYDVETNCDYGFRICMDAN